MSYEWWSLVGGGSMTLAEPVTWSTVSEPVDVAELRAEVRRLRRQLAGMTKERDDQVRRKRTHQSICHPKPVNAIGGPQTLTPRGVR